MSACLQADFDVLVDKLLSMGSECESLRAQLAEARRERDNDREYAAAAMIRCSVATGDGDDLEALIDEWEGQTVELIGELVKLREDIDRHIAIASEHATENTRLREFVAAFDAWQTGPPPMREYYDVMLEKRAAVGD